MAPLATALRMIPRLVIGLPIFLVALLALASTWYIFLFSAVTGSTITQIPFLGGTAYGLDFASLIFFTPWLCAFVFIGLVLLWPGNLTASISTIFKGNAAKSRLSNGLFLVFGLCLITGSAASFVQSAIFLNNSKSAFGTVVKIERDHGAKYPVVDFTLESGKIVEFRSNSSITTETFQAGQKVPLRYDPNNPHEAKIDSFWQNWNWPILISFITAMFIIVTNWPAKRQ